MRIKNCSWLLLLLLIWVTSGCSVGYVIKSSYYQLRLLSRRQPIQKVIDDPKVPADVKHKLQLAIAAKKFAENTLHLSRSDSYLTYVDLHRPYVTWVVRVSEKYRLKPYLWWFPVVGSVPYKGFFNKQGAVAEAKKFSKDKYDTYVRGVSAYSSLGWFDDPLLSSMMQYQDHDLVNIIIHETVHATIYIKSNADFNERLATFLGNIGTERFYTQREGKGSATVKLIHKENADNQLFSRFISGEIKRLGKWYGTQGPAVTAKTKQEQLNNIKERFTQDVLPHLQTNLYREFAKRPLNNAILLSYKTYVQDLSVFQNLFLAMHQDFAAFLKFVKTLQKVKNPQQALSAKLQQLQRVGA